MKLSLLSGARDEVVRISAEGRMTSNDFDTAQRDPLEVLVGHGVFTRKLLVDLRLITFIDSAAVGWLITKNKAFKEKGGMLVLHSAPPNVQKIFSLLKMDTIFKLAADEAAAEALATGEAS